MSLFQCEVCGCSENTALSCQGVGEYMAKYFKWDGMEDRKGKKLCSACAPAFYESGKPSELGVWHGQFKRVFLPLGMFKTNGVGNLEHIETGEENYKKYEIQHS